MSTLQTILALITSLSTVFGIFTAIINKLFNIKLDPIKKNMETEHKDSLYKDLQSYRYHVVSFASDLRRGITKSQFEFEAVFSFIDLYEDGIEELGITNNLFTSEVEYIKQCYRNLSLKK